MKNLIGLLCLFVAAGYVSIDYIYVGFLFLTIGSVLVFIDDDNDRLRYS